MKKFLLLPVALLCIVQFFSTDSSAQVFNKKKKIKDLTGELQQCKDANKDRVDTRRELEKENKKLKTLLGKQDTLIEDLTQAFETKNRKLQALLTQKDSLLQATLTALDAEKVKKAPPVEKKTTNTEPKKSQVAVESKKKKIATIYTPEDDPTE